MAEFELNRLSEYVWEIAQSGKMRVPARIYASEALLDKIKRDLTLRQLVNATQLPGIHKFAVALPDAHQGYGFPVGGVAALDAEDGAVSPGAIGFDINCLSGDTTILHRDGYYQPIANMEANWGDSPLLCQDFGEQVPTRTKAIRYFKQHPHDRVYRIRTEAGHEIKATADHPFWTPNGMTELRQLDESDKVAIHPFQGVSYEAPSDDVLVDASTLDPWLKHFGKGTAGHARTQILNQLRKRNLLPLKRSSPHLPALARLLGFVFGDGSISFGNNAQQGQVKFYARPEDLAPIREDITALGFSPGQIYTRDRHHQIPTPYGGSEFDYRETSIGIASTAFALLLVALGAPYGFKEAQDYRVPQWLFDGPRWHKRLFLASLFGAELSKPATMSDHDYTFYMPVLSLNKHEGFIESGRTFLEGVATLLEDFGVEANAIRCREEERNDKGDRTYRWRLLLSGQSESLVRLWRQVGFEYNRKRSALASTAAQYLMLKQAALDARQWSAQRASELQAAGVSPSRICEELEGPFVNRRFLERSLYSSRKTDVRIAQSFPSFDEFTDEATAGLGTSGMVWDRIVSIEPLDEFNEYVYDFTVDHPDHNFIANGFVVSNCGVRLCRTNLSIDEVRGKEHDLVDTLFHMIPTGIGKGSAVGELSNDQIEDVAREGVRWAVQNGYGIDDDLAHCEDEGVRPGADPGAISQDAKDRGRVQLGSLGSGNHFLEIQRVAEVFDEATAAAYGLVKDQVVLMIHCGSRGFGHQICTDYLKRVEREHRDLIEQLPDRELACAPAQSAAAQDYYKAMNCAINYAWTNRQVIMHQARRAFGRVFDADWRDLGMELLYDVAHNIGKKEVHRVDGGEREVYVHRKGATRAFPAGRPELPDAYRGVGQPVLIPGSMGTSSYVLKGNEKSLDLSFGSTAHGAGRLMSRTQAKKRWRAEELTDELLEQGILVRGRSKRTISEEAPGAYKNADEVVEVSHQVGVATKVVRLMPVGNIKG